MIELFVNIDNQEVQALLDQLPETFKHDVPVVVAEAGADLTRSHIEDLARLRHRSGMSFNFYAEAAASVEQHIVPDGAEISIPHVGFALRYHGGTVKPSGRISAVTGKPIKRLSIPIKGSIAEGRNPGDFNDMFVIKGKKTGTAYLARDRGGMISLLFGLYSKTEHKPDHSILPSNTDYQSAAAAAINQLIDEVR